MGVMDRRPVARPSRGIASIQDIIAIAIQQSFGAGREPQRLTHRHHLPAKTGDGKCLTP